MTTYATIAERTNTTIPPHLEAQAAIPVVNTTDTKPAARQGDVIVAATHLFDNVTHPTGAGTSLTGAGHKVVEGDADRNSHILNGDGAFYPGVWRTGDNATVTDYGVLVVPDNGVTFLTHTEEHGSIGFGPGVWVVLGQLEHGETLRRAAD